MGTDKSADRIFPEILLIIVTAAVIIICALFGRGGSVTAPAEYITLSDGWHYEDTEGRIDDIRLPVSGDASPDLEAATISRRLPETIDPEWYLGVYSSFQEIEVRIGGRVVEMYDHNNSLLATNIPSNLLLLSNLSPQDGGKLLEIRISSRLPAYKHRFNEVYVGNRTGIIGHVLKKKQAVVTEGLIVILSGIVMLLLWLANPSQYGDSEMRLYGALFVLFIGIWLLLQAGVGQLFCEDMEASHFVELMMVFLIPIPTLRFVDVALNRRYVKAINILCAIDLAAVILALGYVLILHRDLMEILTAGHLVIASNAIYGIWIVGKSVIRHGKEVPEFRPLIVAILCFIAGVGVETLMFYLMPLKETGQFFGAFVAAFAFFALYWIVRDGRTQAAKRAGTLRETRAKEMFLANISHEVRTPIHTMTGLTSLVLKDTEEGSILPELEAMQESGNRLLSLVNQILLLSRIRSGSIQIGDEPFETLDLLVRFYEHADGLRVADRIRVVFSNDPDLPAFLRGDEEQILNLLKSIVDNAFTHMEEGVVRLFVGKCEEDGKFCFHVRVKSDSDLTVPDDPAELFDLFEMTDSGMPSPALPLAKQLADLLGGTIEVENEQRRTLSVTVSLPFTPASDEKVGVVSMSPESRAFTDSPYIPDARVLLVDDEPMNRNVMKGIFRSTGIILDTCPGGEEALAQLRRQKYDLIILDYLMPGMDGFEVMSHIRHDEDMPGDSVPVILMTADVSPGVRERMKRAGFSDGLPKPVSGSEINHVLLRYLAERKGGRE